MRANEFVVEGLRDPKDNPCWKGYKPVGTKKKNNKTVPNCVPVDENKSKKDLPQWKKDWYSNQKPNSWPKHPQPYHNPNWVDELSPEDLKGLIGSKQLDELQFLGSECTKDCSGHRAGYNWSKARGGIDAASPWSPSFNKGAALAKAGK